MEFSRQEYWSGLLFPSPLVILVFLILSFKLAFSFFSFILIKRFFSSFSFSDIKVVSSAYLRLLILLRAILIPSCVSFIQAFCKMHSAYKLHKQGDNKQHYRTTFLFLNQSVAPYKVLTVASWPIYRFLRRQVRCSGIPISLSVFHSLLWSTQTKALV